MCAALMAVLRGAPGTVVLVCLGLWDSDVSLSPLGNPSVVGKFSVGTRSAPRGSVVIAAERADCCDLGRQELIQHVHDAQTGAMGQRSPNARPSAAPDLSMARARVRRDINTLHICHGVHTSSPTTHAQVRIHVLPPSRTDPDSNFVSRSSFLSVRPPEECTLRRVPMLCDSRTGKVVVPRVTRPRKTRDPENTRDPAKVVFCPKGLL